MIPQKTTVDWFRFRTQANPLEALEALKPMYGDMGSHLRLKHAQRGILGYQQSAQILIGDMALGRVDYGGESQRGWVRWDITGKGCEWVKDWDAIEDVERLPSTEIRRLDVCLTTWNGEVGHSDVVAAHAAGRFYGATAGRPPALRQIISSDPRAGRTCEVGKREKADKFFRGYEKGFQLLTKLPHAPGEVTHIDGHAIEGIYRCEVELKVENKPIPWEVIERRDQYFAGSYPFLADLLPGVEADILQRRPERAPQMDLAAALENCRIQYGATLFTALHAYHGDMGAVWDRIMGKSHNQSLLEAGVLLVDHDQ
jgi:phage replication initiation protein